MEFYTRRRHHLRYLQTNWLAFDDILFLKDIEDMVEIYYNSGRFQTILTDMIQEFQTPFDFLLNWVLFILQTDFIYPIIQKNNIMRFYVTFGNLSVVLLPKL